MYMCVSVITDLNPKHLKILQIPKMCKLKSGFVYKYLISVEHKRLSSFFVRFVNVDYFSVSVTSNYS